ncbi:MAG: hypothetical protein C4583_04270 [Anaerolineaceae bacterium]|nr:MAG: hypothetical protein C4583_04270 [Anaerolineaceae bacterium]
MDSLIRIENGLSADWMQFLHYMSNEEIRWRFPDGSDVKRWQDGGVWHVQASFPFRRVLVHRAMRRPLCVWRMLDGERVSEAIRMARELFELTARQAAQFSFIRFLPAGAEDGMDVYGCVLIRAGWAPEKCVVIG